MVKLLVKSDQLGLFTAQVKTHVRRTAKGPVLVKQHHRKLTRKQKAQARRARLMAQVAPSYPPDNPEAIEMLKRADGVVINVSGGKDSDALMEHMADLIAEHKVPHDRVVVVNADLGEMEWDVQDHIKARADRLGFEFVVVKPLRPLLDAIEQRADKLEGEKPPWPSSSCRYCTSGSKRDPIAKFIRNRFPTGLILNTMGVRAEESPNRRKMPELSKNTRISKERGGVREVHQWHAIHRWPEGHVWRKLEESGQPGHSIYDEGLNRLSCSFCVMAKDEDLAEAARLRPKLFVKLQEMEKRFGFSFKPKQWLKNIIPTAAE